MTIADGGPQRWEDAGRVQRIVMTGGQAIEIVLTPGSVGVRVATAAYS